MVGARSEQDAVYVAAELAGSFTLQIRETSLHYVCGDFGIRKSGARHQTVSCVADVPENFALVTHDVEIAEILGALGIGENDYSILFVESEDGEYKTVYGCRSAIAWLHDAVIRIK
jgi:hypothetical protein